MGIAICRLPRPGVSDPNEVRSCKHTRPVWVVPGLIPVTWAKAGRSLLAPYLGGGTASPWDGAGRGFLLRCCGNGGAGRCGADDPPGASCGASPSGVVQAAEAWRAT